MAPAPKSSMTPGTSSMPKAASEKKNVWMIVSIILAVALIAVVAMNFKSKMSGGFTPVSKDAASQTLLAFIDKVYSQVVGEATIKEVTEVNGLYKVVVTVNPPENAALGVPAGPVDQTVYITRDGKLFIPTALDIAQVTAQAQAQGQPLPPSPTTDTVPVGEATEDTGIAE